MRILLGLFVMAAMVLCGGPHDLFAGKQADRAVSAVKALMASGQIPRDATIRFVAKEGSIANFWGRDFALKNAWENQTGIEIEATVRPNMPVLDFIRTSADFDITLARVRELPDLFSEHLIMDLTPLVKKYHVVIDDNPVDGFFAPRIQAEFAGKIVAVPADGDFCMLYLRKDLMEDPGNRARFKNTYGRDPAPPKTWDEYQDLIRFFHRPDQGVYGCVEQRDPQTGWMFWMPRYACQAYPNALLFDDAMHPMIDSAAGVAATQSYVASVSCSPEHIVEKGADHQYTAPLFRNGHAFAFMATASLAKMFTLDISRIKGRFMCALMPGKRIGDRLVRRSSFIYGNNIVVSTKSRWPELAFLYASWISDPDISTQSILVTSGQADPYRMNHLNDPRLWPVYTRQAVEIMKTQVQIAVPPGTGLPGDWDYIRVLSRYLNMAARGEVTAKQAMAETAKAWERITERHGRQRQIHHWRAVRAKFPTLTFTGTPSKGRP